MRRFFVDRADRPYAELTGAERKHLADVLRARTGDRVVLCPNDGRDHIYEITAFERDKVTLRYVEDIPNPTEPDLFLCVYVAMLKGDKTELEVQKLTELGARRIVPFTSEYTVKTGEKAERLRRAALEACKQCGRAIVPEVSDAVRFSEVISSLGSYDAAVFAYEGAYGGGLRLTDVIKGNEKKVALVIGPEGGFSENEVRLAENAGYRGVTLGKRILRAETAAIAGAAAIMQMCGEWK